MLALHLFAALVSFAALAAYANYRSLRLPGSIALMLSALAFSLAALALQYAGFFAVEDLRRLVSSIAFGELVLHGLLAFLLFAGALHVDLHRLRNEAWTVGLLATVGVAISASVMGLAFWGVARAIGLELPLAFALLFGVLTAPTDPIAVLAILRQAGAPPALEMQITGESLFNDGVAVVLFISLLGFATAGGAPSASEVLNTSFAREVGGALVLGGAVSASSPITCCTASTSIRWRC